MKRPDTKQFFINEALALQSRLENVKPYSLNMPMVSAAMISSEAQQSVTELLHKGTQDLKRKLNDFIRSLKVPSANEVPPSKIQNQWVALKLRFNDILDQVDIFADVLSQRSEHETGVWMAGLDVLAKDALMLSGRYYDLPPLMCYLDRGIGAAIRRARTRLPGGDHNPAAVVRVPRERMIGSGIGSSLIHEAGHQGAALLALVPSLRSVITMQHGKADNPLAWKLYYSWISEIVADFWAVAKLGVGATLGLISVVSLPSYFVFRMQLDDPHPFPWIRVKISSAIGRVLYPDPQWERIEKLWESIYPVSGLRQDQGSIIQLLEKSIPQLVTLLLDHKPKRLKGKSLKEVFQVEKRQPDKLREHFSHLEKVQDDINLLSPSLVFAMIGQARSDGRISAEKEASIIRNTLTHWALKKH